MFKGLNPVRKQARRINRHLLLLVVALVNTNSSLAAPDRPIWHKFQPVFTLTTGASISQLGQSQSFTPLDLCSYRYNPKGSPSANSVWGGFAGAEIKHTTSWMLVVGLSYYQPTNLKTKGNLTQGADPFSDDIYQYRYKTQSQQLVAESKLYWITNKHIEPFLMFGMGIAFNKTFDYQTSVPPFLGFTPTFSTHSQNNFTYAVGPGLDVKVAQSFRVGVAYRFADLGATNTGNGQIDGIPISNTLKQSRLYANQFLVQLTFIPWINE